MIKLYHLIIILLLLVSCTSNITEYWDNGNIKSEISYLDESKENYFYREYYKTGILKLQAQYVNKKLHGELISYDENGDLLSKTNYTYGTENNWINKTPKTESIKSKASKFY